jgi:hypothetical protein
MKSVARKVWQKKVWQENHGRKTAERKQWKKNHGKISVA